ncbi:MAG: hypothetical protein WB611_09840 [Stellaceae bacterium]
MDEETLVLPVDSIAALEEKGHGVVIERWGQRRTRRISAFYSKDALIELR